MAKQKEETMLEDNGQSVERRLTMNKRNIEILINLLDKEIEYLDDSIEAANADLHREPHNSKYIKEYIKCVELEVAQLRLIQTDLERDLKKE